MIKALRITKRNKTLLLCFAVGLSLFYGIGSIDQELEDHSAFTPAPRLQLTEAENALSDFIKVGKLLSEEDQYIFNDLLKLQHFYKVDGSFDAPFWRKQIENNKDAIAAFESGLEKKGIVYPVAYDIEDTCPYIPAIKCAKLIAIKSLLSAPAENWSKALEELAKIKRAAELIAKSEDTLIGHLIGAAIIDNYLITCHQFLDDPAFPVEHRNTLNSQLLKLDFTPITKASTVDYFMNLKPPNEQFYAILEKKTTGPYSPSIFTPIVLLTTWPSSIRRSFPAEI